LPANASGTGVRVEAFQFYAPHWDADARRRADGRRRAGHRAAVGRGRT